MELEMFKRLKKYVVLPLIMAIVFSIVPMPLFTIDVWAAPRTLYWVEVAGSGTGNWSDINHWSLGSGGVGGEVVPDSDDSVIFDGNSFISGTGTITVDATASCLDMDWTGATNTPTLTLVAPIYAYGDITVIAAMVTTGAAYPIYTRGTTVLTSNTHSFGCRVGTFADSTSLTLADAFVGTSYFIHQGGIFATGNFDATCTTFQDGASATAKTFTLGSSTINCTSWVFSGSNNTLTANTATINVTGTGAVALGTANWNGADFNLNGTAHTVSGSPTGIDIITTPPATTQTLTVTAGSVIKCTTATLSGDATHTHTIKSGTVGTLAQIWATNKTDSFVTYTDMLRNYNGVIVSDCTGAGGGTFAGAGGVFTSMTVQGAGAYTLTVTGANTIPTVTMTAPLGTLLLNGVQDIATLTHTSGTIDFNDLNHTVEIFDSNNANVRIVNMGTGTLTVDSAAAVTKWDITDPTNLTFNHENSTIVLSNAAATAQTFAGGNQTYNNVTVGGAGNYALTLSGDNTFNTFTIDRSAAAKTLTFTSGSTQTITTPVCAVNGVVYVTINSTIAGTPGNIVKAGGGTFDGDYFDITDSAASPAATWYAVRSIDGGGDTGWIFHAEGMTARSAWEWEYDTIFYDSIGVNDATPSFRGASSDADVIATAVSFVPIEEAKAPTWTLDTTVATWVTAPVIVGNFTTTPGPTYPGADVITDIANASGTPAQLPFTILFGFLVLALSLIVTYVMRQSSAGSLLVKFLVIAFAMWIGIVLNVIDFWMMLFFVFMALAILAASKQGDLI